MELGGTQLAESLIESIRSFQFTAARVQRKSWKQMERGREIGLECVVGR